MSLELMYITNRPDVALIAQEAGIDRVFVDMEYIGKSLRQGGMDTVQSHHTVEDVKNLRGILKNTKLLVRVNPIHDAFDGCESSESEIERVIESGADVVMLPYFKTAYEAERFINAVQGRARTCLLVETAEAAENLDSILSVGGIDEIHIGLNDLHLAYKMKFLFELLTDGTVEALCRKIRDKGISYGFGGVARVGTGTLPAECILGEHYRLGSERIILSRAFCDVSKEKDICSVREKLCSGVADLRRFEESLKDWSDSDYDENRKRLCDCVEKIVAQKDEGKQ